MQQIKQMNGMDADRPSKLFDGLEHIRLCIILHHKGEDHSTFSTSYNKWQAVERANLFQKLSFSNTTKLNMTGAMAKVGTSFEASILSTMEQESGLISEYEREGKWEIIYTRKLSHFVKIPDFIPSISDESGQTREPSELKRIPFVSQEHRDVFLAILNSSLFYWMLTVYSDCRNLNRRDIGFARFDFESADAVTVGALTALARKLMDDIRNKSKIVTMNYKKMGALNIQCTYPKLSKMIIDEIDRVLASHYRLTKDEAEFIVNFDIKYRMGNERISKCTRDSKQTRPARCEAG